MPRTTKVNQLWSQLSPNLRELFQGRRSCLTSVSTNMVWRIGRLPSRIRGQTQRGEAGAVRYYVPCCFWRHRTEWDGTTLVSKPLSVAKESVHEVRVEDADMSP